MSKIYYLMGKSATGKDTIFKRLSEDDNLRLKKVIIYTTRPIRLGETQGKEYFFVSEEEEKELSQKGKL